MVPRAAKSWLGESRLFLLEAFKFSDEVNLLPWSKASASTLRHDCILMASFLWLWLSFYFNLLRVVVVASESLLESGQLDAKRRLICGMICFRIQHWKFLSLQFVEITHMRDAKFWWLLIKISIDNIGGGARKWLRSESEALVRGSRGRGGVTCNGGSRGIRSGDGAAGLDRGFALSFLWTGFGFMGFNSIAHFRGALLTNRSSEGDSTKDFSCVFICVASPPALWQDFPHRKEKFSKIYVKQRQDICLWCSLIRVT